MAIVQCFACVFITLLGLSTCGNGNPLPTYKHSVKTDKAAPEGCELRQKTLSTREVNWNRLVQSDEKIVSLHNTEFTISYCSGRCRQHNSKTGEHVIQDDYALQMRNLVKSCEDNNNNCEELTPCCVPKRYHGKNNQSKINFAKTNVRVEYIDKNGDRKEFTYEFHSPTVCHCR